MALTEEEKEALDCVENSNVFMKEFLDEWEIHNEVFKTKDESEIDSLQQKARDFKKELRQEGFATKLRTCGWGPFDVNYMIYVSGVKRRS